MKNKFNVIILLFTMILTTKVFSYSGDHSYEVSESDFLIDSRETDGNDKWEVGDDYYPLQLYYYSTEEGSEGEIKHIKLTKKITRYYNKKKKGEHDLAIKAYQDTFFIITFSEFKVEFFWQEVKKKSKKKKVKTGELPIEEFWQQHENVINMLINRLEFHIENVELEKETLESPVDAISFTKEVERLKGVYGFDIQYSTETFISYLLNKNVTHPGYNPLKNKKEKLKRLFKIFNEKYTIENILNMYFDYEQLIKVGNEYLRYGSNHPNRKQVRRKLAKIWNKHGYETSTEFPSGIKEDLIVMKDIISTLDD